MNRDAMPLSRLVRSALRSRARRARTVIIGVATSTALVLALLATYQTVTLGIVSYTGQPTIDLWVAPRGTDNLVRSSPVLRSGVVDELATVEGVRTAAPILRSFVTAESVDQRHKCTLLAIGFRGPDGLGRPPLLDAGRLPAALAEIALDRAAAYLLDVAVNDEVLINDDRLAVVGITRRTNLIATQFAFMDIHQMEVWSGLLDASLAAVALADGADHDAVAHEIAQRLAVDVFSREVWVENNLREVAAGFLPVVTVMSAVGLIAAIVLVVLLVQSVVDDRRAEIAVLIAMGAPLLVISRAIVAHVARLVSVGSMLGAACGWLLALALDRWVPTVEMQITWQASTGIIATMLLVGVVAAIVPTLRIRVIDPVEAFRP